MAKYFTMAEMTRSETAKKLKINNTPDTETTERLNELMAYLDTIREEARCPLYVNSGYRCKKLNRIVGGVGNSQHMKGEAADLDTRTGNNKALFDLIRKMGGFDQLIWENGGRWIHVSHKKNGNRGQVIR